MEIYISTYNNFRLKQIPNNILCIGVSKEIPEDFKTTSIHNFLYTPKSILGGTYSSQITPEDFIQKYKEHIHQKIVQMKYGSLENYFLKMFTTFENGEWKGICFLDDSIAHWYDVAVILKDVLKDIGYSVKEYSKNNLKSDDNSLF